MSKHTPGPWKWAYNCDSKAIVTAARNSPNPRKAIYDFTLARVEAWTPAETKANARLIAKAPEMAELLRKGIGVALIGRQRAAVGDDISLTNQFIDEARALLAEIDSNQ